MNLTLDEYQRRAAETAIYPRDTEAAALTYVALGLTGEAGEIANRVKKILRDDAGALTPNATEAVVGELGDVLWYCAQLASELGWSLDGVARANLHKLASRKDRGVLGGAGDQR